MPKLELTSAIAKRISPLAYKVEKVFHGSIVMVLPHKDTALMREQTIRHWPYHNSLAGTRQRGR